MANRPAFGRRVAIVNASPPGRVKSVRPERRTAEVVGPEEMSPPIEPRKTAPVDHELEEWKRARKKGIVIPWRPLSLMASLCFGLASFVLPDSITDVAQWPLYGLMAASFYVGVKMRREKREARSSERAEAAAS